MNFSHWFIPKKREKKHAWLIMKFLLLSISSPSREFFSRQRVKAIKKRVPEVHYERWKNNLNKIFLLLLFNYNLCALSWERLLFLGRTFIVVKHFRKCIFLLCLCFSINAIEYGEKICFLGIHLDDRREKKIFAGFLKILNCMKISFKKIKGWKLIKFEIFKN